MSWLYTWVRLVWLHPEVWGVQSAIHKDTASLRGWHAVLWGIFFSRFLDALHVSAGSVFSLLVGVRFWACWLLVFGLDEAAEQVAVAP